MGTRKDTHWYSGDASSPLQHGPGWGEPFTVHHDGTIVGSGTYESDYLLKDIHVDLVASSGFNLKAPRDKIIARIDPFSGSGECYDSRANLEAHKPNGYFDLKHLLGALPALGLFRGKVQMVEGLVQDAEAGYALGSLTPSQRTTIFNVCRPKLAVLDIYRG